MTGDNSNGTVEPLFDIETDEVTAGTQIIHVRNTQLAAALLSVGVPLRRDPPYRRVRKANGAEIVTYNFFPCSPDGSISAVECIKAWHKDLDFIKANPQHPFTFAMCAVKNLHDFNEHHRVKDPEPFIAFRLPAEESPLGVTSILTVKEHSKKAAAARARGYKQL